MVQFLGTTQAASLAQNRRTCLNTLAFPLSHFLQQLKNEKRAVNLKSLHWCIDCLVSSYLSAVVHQLGLHFGSHKPALLFHYQSRRGFVCCSSAWKNKSQKQNFPINALLRCDGWLGVATREKWRVLPADQTETLAPGANLNVRWNL